MKPQPAVLAVSALFLAALAVAAPPRGLPDCAHHGPFKGITPTDAVGNVVGQADAKDWGCIGSLGLQDVPLPPPTSLCFGPAYPNPATDAVSLRISIPREASVSVVVYGQHWRGEPREVFAVRTLVDATLAAGLHLVTWDLRDGGGARVPAGTYRAVLLVGGEEVCGDVEVQ